MAPLPPHYFGYPFIRRIIHVDMTGKSFFAASYGYGKEKKEKVIHGEMWTMDR